MSITSASKGNNRQFFSILVLESNRLGILDKYKLAELPLRNAWDDLKGKRKKFASERFIKKYSFIYEYVVQYFMRAPKLNKYHDYVIDTDNYTV